MSEHPTDEQPLRLDGHTPIPPTHVAAVVTYWRCGSPLPHGRGSPSRAEPLPLAAIGTDIARYRALYAAIGTPWLWFGRAGMSDDALLAILGDRRSRPWPSSRTGATSACSNSTGGSPARWNSSISASCRIRSGRVAGGA